MADGSNIKSFRQILTVQKGEKGIRQSDAFFIHVNTMPELYEKLAKQTQIKKVKAVGVSTKPRNVEGSYMPVFLAGASFAKVIADTLGVPLYEFSHQDGHIMAGIFSSDAQVLLSEPFLSVHLSGGTTEILRSEYKNQSFANEIIGASTDISAGQFIDRVGVRLGLDFPCGKKLEELAENSDEPYIFPISVKNADMSFSGVETKASRIINEISAKNLAMGVFLHVAKTLAKALNYSVKKTGLKCVLLVGGVASNRIIREYLKKYVSAKLFFASREYSTDNAAGIAVLTGKKYEIE
ncbi:MAG: hypothetical protein N2171_05085 [Clostridia bacterium]|nr:hypothetical protein [Clostridia bacterium]